MFDVAELAREYYKGLIVFCKADPCETCCLMVKVISVLCMQCGEWIHSRFPGVKMLLTMS